MAAYRTTKEIRIPKGTYLAQPVPYQKENVTYGHAVIDARLSDKFDDINTHVSLPLDAALKAGLIDKLD